MKNIEQFCINILDAGKESYDNAEKYSVYRDSINFASGTFMFLAIVDGTKKLIVYKESNLYKEFAGDEHLLANGRIKICDLSNRNCLLIRRLFPFTNPVSHKGRDITLGLGDRLGLASPGHIRLLKGKNVFPVLAQQSIRELNLTGRTYDDVLSAAAWAVFQEGYRDGFGADGDHLKTPEEVKMALDNGFTMITLDCSEYIDNTITALQQIEIDRLYDMLPPGDRKYLETKYANKDIVLRNGAAIRFTTEEFRKTVLIYIKAIRYTIKVYHDIIKKSGKDIDFEMSIDETLTSTTPESHFFVASELIDGGVDITSLAPRFYGEFQKGVDYRGDIEQFTREFEVHAEIARELGYKISVHSGSDKFSVFPVIGKLTGNRFHLKTAGTNWLEAVRIIAERNPTLYRRMHKFALARLDEAKKYYHISADTTRIPDIDTLEDYELPGLMDKDDSRQLLHITYGLILQAKNNDAASMFRHDIYACLGKYENEYYKALQKHIGRHLSGLGIML